MFSCIIDLHCTWLFFWIYSLNLCPYRFRKFGLSFSYSKNVFSLNGTFRCRLTNCQGFFLIPLHLSYVQLRYTLSCHSPEDLADLTSNMVLLQKTVTRSLEHRQACWQFHKMVHSVSVSCSYTCLEFIDECNVVYLPPATKLGQGNIFRSVCQEFCSQGGGGLQAHYQGGGWGVWLGAGGALSIEHALGMH